MKWVVSKQRAVIREAEDGVLRILMHFPPRKRRNRKERKRTRRALLLPSLPTDARDVVDVRFALEVWEAVVVGEVFRMDEAASAVFGDVEIGWFAVNGHESLSFGEEGCCESRGGHGEVEEEGGELHCCGVEVGCVFWVGCRGWKM